METIASRNQAHDFTYISESGFYLLSRVWTSTAPLFEWRVGVDSLLCMVLKLTLLRLASRLCQKRCKTRGHPVSIMIPYTTQSSSSTSSTSTCHIWICTSPRLQVSLFFLFCFFGYRATSGYRTQPNVNQTERKLWQLLPVAHFSELWTLSPPLWRGLFPVPLSPLCLVTGCHWPCSAGGIWSVLPSLLSLTPLPLQFLYAMLQ